MIIFTLVSILLSILYLVTRTEPFDFSGVVVFIAAAAFNVGLWAAYLIFG